VRPIVIVASLLALAFLAGACGLFPDEDDEAYVRAFCLASTEFSNRLQAASSEPALLEAISAYRAALASIQPPDDAAAYHAGLLAYLDDVAANPSSRLEQRPPLPPGDVRRRLENAASGLSECDGERFFANQ
jgi:hypothetical protein